MGTNGTGFPRNSDNFSQGDYGISYVDRRLQIGLVLKRIRIDPKRYLAAMKILKDLMFENLAHCGAEPALWITAQRALDKLRILISRWHSRPIMPKAW